MPPSPTGMHAAHYDIRCRVPVQDHPGGHCPDRDVAATRIREGDLVITRHTPPDPARRWNAKAHAARVQVDRRATRHAVARRLRHLAGASPSAVTDQWLDDPAPLPRRYPGIDWLVS
ncbi:hypothetical protein [Euzebya pacifica]|nr:hypothetical protein [Euzebya pacifica]